MNKYFLDFTSLPFWVVRKRCDHKHADGDLLFAGAEMVRY